MNGLQLVLSQPYRIGVNKYNIQCSSQINPHSKKNGFIVTLNMIFSVTNSICLNTKYLFQPRSSVTNTKC